MALAGSLRRRGLGADDILAALRWFNSAQCSPPKADSDLQKIASDINQRYQPAAGQAGSFVWEPEPMSTFLADEKALEPLMEGMPIYKECVTEVFSPRGLGKALWVEGIAVELAKKYRVLLLDRDNSRKIVKSRLRAWGVEADCEKLKAITREKCPPLTRPDLWATFPYDQFDVVILDSLDAMAEGMGEQDSARPSRAIAPLLDIVHRPGGPALLVLGNCVRSGKHSRGNGVIEDRSDLSFEVRDATGLSPKTEDWVQELPLGDAASWADRNRRRRRREKYRLAFVLTKTRVGQEPDPFIIELNLSTEPWTYTDVTDSVDLEGAENRKRLEAERAARLEAAVAALKREITRRLEAQESPLHKRQDAEPILRGAQLGRDAARTLLEERRGKDWMLRPDPDDKRATHVLPLGVVWEPPHYVASTEAAKTPGETAAECGGAHEQGTATSDPDASRVNSGRGEGA